MEYVLDKMLHVPRPPVQVAFLQGAIPLQAGACFDKLIDLLQGPTGGGDVAVWPSRPRATAAAAQRKEAAAWRTTGSSWLGRRIILEPRASAPNSCILAGRFEVQPSVEKGAEENDLMVRSGGRRNSVHGNGRRLPAAR